MNPIKQEAKKLIDTLPDNITWDDIMYEFYVRQKIEKAETFVEEGGKTHSIEEAEKHLRQV